MVMIMWHHISYFNQAIPQWECAIKLFEWRSLNNYKIFPLKPQNVHHDPFPLVGSFIKLLQHFFMWKFSSCFNFDICKSEIKMFSVCVNKNIDWQHLKFSFHSFAYFEKIKVFQLNQLQSFHHINTHTQSIRRECDIGTCINKIFFK